MFPLPWIFLFILLFFSYGCLLLFFSYSSPSSLKGGPLFVKPIHLDLLW